MLAVAMALGSLALIAFAVPPPRRLAAIALVAGVAFVAVAAEQSVQLSFLPPVVINLMLAAWFGLTLRAGHEPIVSRIARIERGTLDENLTRYTRTLTVVWTALFVAMALVSAVLATRPSPTAWTWFTAVGNWVCVAMLFVGEYIYRRVRFWRYPHASPARVVALIRARWRQ